MYSLGSGIGSKKWLMIYPYELASFPVTALCFALTIILTNERVGKMLKAREHYGCDVTCRNTIASAVSLSVWRVRVVFTKCG